MKNIWKKILRVTKGHYKNSASYDRFNIINLSVIITKKYEKCTLVHFSKFFQYFSVLKDGGD